MKLRIAIILIINCAYAAPENSSLLNSYIPKDGKVNAVFFVPDDAVKNLLLTLINHETQSISLAQYCLTDKDITLALLRAHARNVKIRIITDASCLRTKKEQVSFLRKNGIPVRVYQKPFSIMHNKFYIFNHTIYGRQLVWSGSSNATMSGVSKNEENVFITDNRSVMNRYCTKFEKLWTQTKELTLPKAATEDNTQDLPTLLTTLLETAQSAFEKFWGSIKN